MLKDVYGNDYMKNTHAKNIYSELERLACDDIDINEFLEFARTHPGLLFPAFNMQEIIRNRVLGAAFWEHHSQKRIQISKGKYTTIGNFMVRIFDEIENFCHTYNMYIGVTFEGNKYSVQRDNKKNYCSYWQSLETYQRE